ncbi:MAG: helix-turn-helix domain-containing protein [Amphiplicatus sp.]
MSIVPGALRSPDLVSRIATEAMDVACEAYRVALFEMKAKRRSRSQVAYARQMAMYLAHVVGQLSLNEIALLFERDRRTVAYACHIIEDRRDGPFYDRQVELLEIALRERLQAIFARLRLFHELNLAETAAARAMLR